MLPGPECIEIEVRIETESRTKPWLAAATKKTTP